jgi:hypothetical protein
VKATQREVDVTSTDGEVCHSLRLFILSRILDICFMLSLVDQEKAVI